MKAFSVIKAILSGLVWGLGQLFNRQYLKALFFFVFFVAFIGIEIGTSNYGETTDPYSKVDAADLDDEFFQGWQDYYEATYPIYEIYQDDTLNLCQKDEDFETFLSELEADGKTFNQEEGIKYLATELEKSSPSTYTDLTLTSDNVYLATDMDESSVTASLTNLNIYELDGVFYVNPEEQGTTDEFYFLEVDPVSLKETTGQHLPYQEDAVKYYKSPNVIVSNDTDSYGLSLLKYEDDGTTIISSETYAYDLSTKSIIMYENDDVSTIENNYLVYVSNDYSKVYTYYQAGLLANGNYMNYKENIGTENFKLALQNQFDQLSNVYSNIQMKKFALRVILELNSTLKTDFETRLDNFYYDQAGLFVQSYWGVVSLGSTDDVNITEHQAIIDVLFPDNVSVDSQIIIQGHVSVFVLLEGLIGVILSFFFFIFGIWSIIDAYKVAEKKRKAQKVEKGLNWFKETYENGFEYIILSPAVFVLAFISVMPIVFGFILAFTSISGGRAYSGNFDYVGFKNFGELLNFNGALGSTFGKSFWRVLGWTLIWAVFSTATCFFGGLLQALIINSEHVIFRRMWRSILILPWAIPALLSQMVFSVMFKETGFVNQVVENLGFYGLFRAQGILGTNANPLDYNTLSSVKQFFYLGKANIEWFSNSYNTKFVRTTLIVVNLWLGFPYFMALMSGIMTSIDKTLYEAADIAGATKGQQIRMITFPLVLQSTAPILIMTFSGNFNNFGVIYFITQGGPNADMASKGFAGDTDILISWMYKLTVDYSIFNMASVFSVLIFFVVGSISAWNLSRTKAFSEDE